MAIWKDFLTLITNSWQLWVILCVVIGIFFPLALNYFRLSRESEISYKILDIGNDMFAEAFTLNIGIAADRFLGAPSVLSEEVVIVVFFSVIALPGLIAFYLFIQRELANVIPDYILMVIGIVFGSSILAINLAAWFTPLFSSGN